MEGFQKETLVDSVNYENIVSALVGEGGQPENQLSGMHGNCEPDVTAGLTAHGISNYGGVELGQSITYPSKLKKCMKNTGSHEEMRDNDQALQEDMRPEDKHIKFDHSDGVLTLFPFVCGICDEKFNALITYFLHISMHENANALLHSCDQTDKEAILFSCGICDIKYPSLCTLYNHLLETEGVSDFIYRGRERTAHAYTETIEKIEIPQDSSECYRVKGRETQDLNKGIKSHVTIDELKFDIKSPLDKDKDDLHGNSGDESDTTIINESVVGEGTEVGRKYMQDQKAIERNCLKSKRRGRRKVINKNAKIKLSNKCKKAIRRDSTRKTNLADTDRETSLIVEEGNTPVIATYGDDSDHDGMLVDGINDDGMNCQEDNIVGKRSKKKRETINRKDQLFPCEVCGAVVKHQYLQRHRITHEERTLACDQCDNVYNCKFKLRTHKKQVHTDEKKFTCDECGKSFKAWPYLKQHRQIHIKERNIQCPLCPMKFKYAAVLKVHLKTHSDQKPHSCEQCGKKFKRADLLTTHKRYHKDDKPFPCPECSKTFKVKQDMKKHFKIHLPPKFFCGICGKSFVQKHNLRIHMKVHGEFHEK